MDGETRTIGADRALVLDVIRQAAKVPSFPVERNIDLAKIAAFRQQSSRRISWTALFTRAYGLASRENPQLRQIYVHWPWPRIYQHPSCTISIAVNRSMCPGVERLFFGRVHSPDERSLLEIQSDLDLFQSAEPAQVFRSQWRGAQLPALIRRIGWWWRMDVDYRNRARRVGTGSISALAGQGVTNRLHPCIMTSSFSFGPLDQLGNCLVTLQCDHRVLDGSAAANALNSLCEHMTGQVQNELEQLSQKSRETFVAA
jgi:2-oxoacid dehydrogenases acyltransferase (catalytic domain)